MGPPRHQPGTLRVKFGLTTPPYWSKRSPEGWETMSVRATSLAFLFGAMVLGGASAAEPPPAPAAPSRRRTTSGGERGAARRRRQPDAPGRRSQPEDRHPRLHARQSLPGGDRHAAGHVPASAQDRGDRPRPDQGVPLRPRHAGRLAHGDRPRAPGAHRQGLRDRGRQRSARAPRARSCGHRPRGLPAHHRAGEPRAGAASLAPPADSKPAAIRGRWW